MADVAGPHRLLPPAHQAYDTSPGEQTVLRGITPDNMGAMYGLLVNQRVRGDSALANYETLVKAVNAQQGRISDARTAFDNRELEHKTIGNLVQHGGLPSSAALSGLGLTGGNGALAPFLNREQTVATTLNADDIRRQVDQGKATRDIGAGTWDLANAGVLPTEGQTIGPGVPGLLGIQRTIGQPIPITTAALAAAGRGTGKGPQFEVYFDDAAQEYRTRVKAGNAVDAFNGAAEVQRMSQTARDATVTARRGNIEIGGAIPNRPLPTPPPVAPTVTSPGSRTNRETGRPPAVTGPAAGAQARPVTPVGAPLTNRERDIIRGAEARHGRMSGYERTGDGKLIVTTPRGRYEVPRE